MLKQLTFVKLSVQSIVFLCLNSLFTQAQCNLLCNTDFENNQITMSVAIVDASNVPCWQTTASDNKIEVWHTGFNGVPSYSGNQFIELNAYMVSTLYQNFLTAPGNTLSISFAHRGRAGIDSMSVEIGPVGGPYTFLGIFADNNSAWGYYTLNYIVPSGLGSAYSLRFNSVYASGGNPAIGNFLDAISVGIFSNASLSLTSIGSICTLNGSAQAIVSGGSPPFTYTWSPAGGNSSIATGLGAGIYSVNVTESTGCLLTGTVQIVQGSGLAISLTSQSVTCLGANDGLIYSGVLGGQSPYTYTWSPVGANTSSVSGLPAGNYTLNVSSSNGCSGTGTINVTQGLPLAVSLTSQSITCLGANDGLVHSGVLGGQPPYTYTWSPVGANTSSVSGLPAGNYTLNVSSSNGCSGTGTVNVTQGLPLAVSLTSQSITCLGANDGLVHSGVLGGQPPYTYTWSPVGANTSSVSGLPAGNYTLNVSSSNGCSGTGTVNVTQGLPLAVSLTSQSITCLGANDGLVHSGVLGGQPPYTYTWSPVGANTSSVSGLPAGNYTLNVSSSNGCSGTGTINVTQGLPLAVSLTSQSITCLGANDGLVHSGVLGGQSPYTYTWSPVGANTSSVSGLPAGNYTLNVSSSNGCSGTGTINVTQGLPLAVSLTSQSITCLGANDGLVHSGVLGGQPPYTYTWSPVGANTSSVSGLPAGNYTLNVSSSNGCSGTGTVNVTQGLPLAVSLTSQSITCLGANDGLVHSGVLGGQSPYTYTWSPVGANTSSVSGLPAGNYTLNVSSSNGCSGTGTVNVTQGLPLNITFVTTNVSCYGFADGSIQSLVGGGIGPYSYNWFPLVNTTSIISGLSVGTYTLEVYSSNNCSSSAIAQLIQPDSLEIVGSSQNVSCYGYNNGSAQVSLVGGILPYSYTWSSQIGNLNYASNLSEGSYTCQVSDHNFCTVSKTFTITEPLPGNMSVTSSTVCQGENTSLFASGAQSYTWSPGNYHSNIVNYNPLSTTQYTIVGMDLLGCLITKTTSIYVNPSPSVFAGNDTTLNMGEEMTLFGIGSDFYGWISTDINIPLVCLYCHELNVSPLKNTCYVLQAINQFNCKNRDTICVTVTNNWEIYLPNAFTPNGDDINDRFIPVGYGVDEIELTIYDRWGALLFKSNEKGVAWDGTYKNGICKSDVYTYKIIVKAMNGRYEEKVGSVILIK